MRPTTSSSGTRPPLSMISACRAVSGGWCVERGQKRAFVRVLACRVVPCRVDGGGGWKGGQKRAFVRVYVVCVRLGGRLCIHPPIHPPVHPSTHPSRLAS